MARDTVEVEIAPLEPYVSGLVCIRLARGATVADAIAFLEIELPEDFEVGIWGRSVRADQPLSSDDRLEFTQSLRIDPKAARRARVEARKRRNRPSR